VVGVAEGRLIFANLKKSIRYALTHILPQLVGFIFYVILRIPPPITSMLALFVDLGTEMGPSVSLAWEPPEGDLMLIPPRKVLMKPLPAVSFRDIEAAAGGTVPAHQQTTSMWRKYWNTFTRWIAPDQTGEVLIDNDLIIWSYLEGGVIEGLGCFGSYLIALAILNVPFNMLISSADTYWKTGAPPLTLTDGTIADAQQQINISGSAKSAFFWGIVLCQMFNLFLQKHRYSYPWGRDMLVYRFIVTNH
jgi:sodium/potassium-transporting ATPase subunit alpha